MNEQTEFGIRLREHFALVADTRPGDDAIERLMTTVRAMPRRRPRVDLGRGFRVIPQVRWILAVGILASAMVGALVIAGGAPRAVDPPPAPSQPAVIDDPSHSPPSPSTAASPEPSASTVTAPPTQAPTSGPLAWTPERLAEDWPAPVRSEPPGGAAVVTMELGDDAGWSGAEWEPYHYEDPVGDVPSGVAWIDIAEVTFSPGGSIQGGLRLAGDIPLPIADPADRWMAYGFVLDTNGDGTADVRVGIDNLERNEHRAWRTDLTTGVTSARAGPPYGSIGWESEGGTGPGLFLDSYYPGEDGQESARRAIFRGDDPSVREQVRFYAWASLIENGHVVATDYAPDDRWLEEGQQPDLPLVGPDWRIERRAASEPGRLLTFFQRILFLPDDRISFATGCETGYANVRVGPTTLRFRDLDVVEEPTCSGRVAAHAATFMAILSAGEVDYAVDGGTLTLRAGSDRIDLVGPHEGDPAPGVLPGTP